jgi:hypothetical protein
VEVAATDAERLRRAGDVPVVLVERVRDVPAIEILERCARVSQLDGARLDVSTYRT